MHLGIRKKGLYATASRSNESVGRMKVIQIMQVEWASSGLQLFIWVGRLQYLRRQGPMREYCSLFQLSSLILGNIPEAIVV